MGRKDRKKIKVRQRVNRKKKRRKLREKGLDPDKFYYGRYYVGRKEPTGL